MTAYGEMLDRATDAYCEVEIEIHRGDVQVITVVDDEGMERADLIDEAVVLLEKGRFQRVIDDAIRAAFEDECDRRNEDRWEH